MAFKFIVLFGLLAAANAGHLTSGYVDYAPATVAKTIQYAEPVHSIQYAAAPVAKTIEYAAPVTKTIYQPSPVIAKTVVEPEPYNYHAHAYAPTAYATSAYAPSAYAAHGTGSHYGKTIATPHSYVSKYDTRYVHEDPHYYPTVVKTPAIVKTPIVAAPIVPTVVKTPVYSAPVVPTVVKTPVYSAPVVPTVVKSPVYSAPIVKSYDSYDHSYAHAAPVIAKAAVAYSPAVAVSHATFESAHGHYAW